MSNARQLTMKDKAKLEAELAELNQAKKDVAEEIKIARGFGDLSENAEYDAAKDREQKIYSRFAEVEALLSKATFVDESQVSLDTVSLGTVVTVLDMDLEEEDTYTLVGFTESDPNSNMISQESAIGKALIGAHVGDTVTVDAPGGAFEMKIMNIARR